MPRPWKRPDLPPSPLSELNRALHELHHKAGWPSSREIRRALDAKGVLMSHTKVHDTLTKPVLPTKGAVEMITEVLAETIRGADINTEVDRLFGLWHEASIDHQTLSPVAEPPPAENRQPYTWQQRDEKTVAEDIRAMTDRGRLFEGVGEKDEAALWYRRAAEAGDTTAMYRLGILLLKRSEAGEAEMWFRCAAENGHTRALHELGDLLESRGEKSEAEAWYRRAAEDGRILAMKSLAHLLKERGKVKEADTWYRRAAGMDSAGAGPSANGD